MSELFGFLETSVCNRLSISVDLQNLCKLKKIFNNLSDATLQKNIEILTKKNSTHHNIDHFELYISTQNDRKRPYIKSRSMRSRTKFLIFLIFSFSLFNANSASIIRKIVNSIEIGLMLSHQSQNINWHMFCRVFCENNLKKEKHVEFWICLFVTSRNVIFFILSLLRA